MIGLYWGNLIDDAALEGGSWVAARPLTALQTEQLSDVARSSSASATHTQFDAVWGSSQTIQVVAFVAHNMNAAAQWDISIGTSLGGSESATTGASDVWRFTKPASLGGSSFMAVHRFQTAKTGTHLRIAITDTGNSDGYVQGGRVFVGAGAEFNAVHDSYRSGFVDLSGSDRADGGTKWNVERPMYRWESFVMPTLTHDETATLQELILTHKTVKEVLYLPNVEDMAFSQRWGFLGSLAELSEIEWPYARTRSMPLRVEQRI